jgi:hypothetical protein
MIKNSFLLILFCMGLSRCSNTVDLSSMKIRIWQPEGENYFADADTIKLSVTTARDLAYEQQAQSLNELTLDLATLTPSDTPLELELTATQEDDIYKGYVEAYELDWPAQDLTAVQEDPLMFVGPANVSVSLTQGYPPSLIDTMVCQTHQGALVLGTSVAQDTASEINTYFMDFMGRSLNSGPTLSSLGAQSICALDAENHLYTYGGCIEDSPTGGLQKITLDANATAVILTEGDARSSCHSDLVVTAQHLWLIDGATLELRNYEGQRQQALTLPTNIPFQLTRSADLDSDQIWVWSTAPSENETLRLVSQDDDGLTIQTVELEGTLLYVGHNRHQQAICLTTEGLYALNEGLPSLLMNASLIFEGNFQPTQFIESQPDRWVFLNDAGSLFRLVQGSTNYDLPQDPARPQSQLFRGPGGAIFIAGGPSTGIHLLITDTY